MIVCYNFHTSRVSILLLSRAGRNNITTLPNFAIPSFSSLVDQVIQDAASAHFHSLPSFNFKYQIQLTRQLILRSVLLIAP